MRGDDSARLLHKGPSHKRCLQSPHASIIRLVIMSREMEDTVDKKFFDLHAHSTAAGPRIVLSDRGSYEDFPEKGDAVENHSVVVET